MNKLILLITFLILSISLTGCTSNYSSATQIEDSGYVLLKGNFNNTILYVDDTSTVIDSTTKQYSEQKQFEKKQSDNNQMVSKFPITIGVHTIKVVRDNQTLVNRKVYLTNGQTIEITVP